MKVMLTGLLLTVFCTQLFASGETLVFSAIPDQDKTQLKKRFDKVAHYLSETLDIKVRFLPVKSYAAAVTAFRNNQVQLAWFGGLSGVQARRLVPDSKAIAQGAEDTEFKTYFIANSATGLKAESEFPVQIAGKTFAFGSKGSTSGRLMPEFYIRQHLKKSPDDTFKTVGFSGNHSRTISLVESGAYQVGAVNYKVWETAVTDGKVDTTKVGRIWSTPSYPDYQWTIRGDVDRVWGKGFADRVQQALLNMNDRDLLASFPRSGFIPAKNADYQPILETAKKIGIID